MDYFNNITNIVINISHFTPSKAFKYISSLSIIEKYSYVKIKDLKNNIQYNSKIGQVIAQLPENRYKININNKILSISKNNIELYPIILYFKPEEIPLDILKYYNIGFNIPLHNHKNYIVIFYKGDYYFENINNITKIKLDSFFNNSSFDSYTKCNICMNETLYLIACNICVYTYCEKCLLKFKKKKCPYCQSPIKYDIK